MTNKGASGRDRGAAQHGNPLGSTRAESDRLMLRKAFVETADYHVMANGPAYNAVVGRRGAGKSALFIRLSEHFERLQAVVVLPVKPSASAFIGLVGVLQDVLGGEAKYEHAREVMRHCWQAVFHAHLLVALKEKELPPWLSSNPLDSAVAFVDGLRDRSFHQVVYTSGKTASALEGRVRELLSNLTKRGVVLIDGIDEGWSGAEVENGVIGGLAAAAADLQDREAGVRLVIFIRDNMYRILSTLDPDFSRILAGDSLRLNWDHDSLLELVAARVRPILKLDSDVKSVEAWNRLARNELSGKSGFRGVLKHTLYRPRDVLELLNTSIQTAQRKGRREIVPDDVEEGAQRISADRLNALRKEYDAVLPGLNDQLQAFAGRPAVTSLGELRTMLAEYAPQLTGQAAMSAARLGTNARLLQALFAVGFIGLEETTGGFRFRHDGSDIALDGVSDATRVAVHPCYHRALDLVWPEGEPLDVLLNSTYEYGEVPSHAHEVQELLLSRCRDLVERLARIAPGAPDNGLFEEWVRETIEVLFAADLKNIELHPSKCGPMRRDVVGSIEATNGPWRRIADYHRAQQAVFEVKNYEDLDPDAFLKISAYTGEVYGSVGFIVYRGNGPNPNANERSHLVAHRTKGKTIVLLPQSLLQRLLKKQNARDIQDKFRKWYDNHLRNWGEPDVGPR